MLVIGYSRAHPINLLYALGMTCWPVGYAMTWVWDDRTGRIIAGVGGVLVLVALASQLLVRRVARRRQAEPTEATDSARDRSTSGTCHVPGDPL